MKNRANTPITGFYNRKIKQKSEWCLSGFCYFKKREKVEGIELQNQDQHGTTEWIAPQICPTQ